MSVPLLQSPFLPCFEQFGWHTKDGDVCITWDDEDSLESDSEAESVKEESEDSDQEDELRLQVFGDSQEDSDHD